MDRRFDRPRYNAEVTAAAFGARLRAVVDLDDIAADLVATAGAAVQPATVSLWLAPGTAQGPADDQVGADGPVSSSR